MYQTRIICARVFLACINREEETTEARKVQRERDTMGEILMISRWIIFLWCFCFGVKNLSQIFEKRNAPLTAPPQKTTNNYEAKECNRWSNTKNIIERTKRTQEQKRKKRRKITHELCFYYSTHHLSHPTNRHTSSSQQRDSLTLFCETKKERETARNLKEVHHVYIFSFAKERLRFVIKNTSKS
jgi:hypothetical protein